MAELENQDHHFMTAIKIGLIRIKTLLKEQRTTLRFKQLFIETNYSPVSGLISR